MDYNQIIYQIYPLGFCGAPMFNDFKEEHRILKVIDWIPHFRKLGVTQILFNPVFQSIRHGYDTISFERIDMRLGTNEDFALVCQKLEENGIGVILDGVFNHVGRDFEYFKDVREKRWDSPYKDWFFVNFDDPNGPDGFWYANWEGYNELVKLNVNNPEVQNYLFSQIDTWIDQYHIKGIRLDVAYCLTQEFLYSLTDHIKSKYPDFFLLGEMIGGDYNVLMHDGQLDSVTNYECRKGLYSSMNTSNLFEIGYSLNRQFGKDPWCLYTGKHLLSFVDNHDVDRIASVLDDERDLPLVYSLMYAMPGIPCIYYGSEWGTKAKRTKWSDDDLRPCFDAPQQNDLFTYISKLNEMRLNCSAFTNGDYKQVYLQNKQIVFIRKDDIGQLTYILNIEDTEKQLSFNAEVESGTDLLTGENVNLTNPVSVDAKSAKFIYTKW